jgi:hypothetical protein
MIPAPAQRPKELITRDKFFTSRKLSSYSGKSKISTISVEKRKRRALEIKKENEKEIIREVPFLLDSNY